MTSKIDKSRCARLVVESDVLTRILSNEYSNAMFTVKMTDKLRRVYKKSLHVFKRRLALYDTIVAVSKQGSDEIYVGKCREYTPMGCVYFVTTNGGDTIYFDTSEFAKR